MTNQSAAAPASSPSAPSPSLAASLLSRAQSFLRSRPALAWQAPLLLLAWVLLRRRVRRVRRELYASLPSSFWLASTRPPHGADSDSLPGALGATQGLYAILPLSLQHSLRDSGAFGVLADLSALLAGAVWALGRPGTFGRMFGWGAVSATSQSATAGERGMVCGLPYGPQARHTLDVLRSHRRCLSSGDIDLSCAPTSPGSVERTLSPVMLFVHGGAWGSGRGEMYRLIALPFDESAGFVVVVPSYTTYPQAGVQGQVDDVRRVLSWVRNHASSYGGDPRRIFLAGHSSGAHVGALVCLAEAAGEGVGSAAGETPAPAPIAGFIGLSGVYAPERHFHFESARGVMELSPMRAACGGDEEGMRAFSAARLAAQLTEAQRQRFPPALLLHGASDDTVPYSQSLRMAYALSGRGMDSDAALPIPPLPSHATYHAAVSSSTAPLLSLTFPTPLSSSPLVQLRICGAASDPLRCDHASFLFDLMNSRVRLQPDGAAKFVSVGHTQWLLESIAAFRTAVELRADQAQASAEIASKSALSAEHDVGASDAARGRFPPLLAHL